MKDSSFQVPGASPYCFPNTLKCISEVRIIDERETEGEEMISDWKYCMWKPTGVRTYT